MDTMTGMVDPSGRALLPIRLRHPTTAAETRLDVWVDTGFTGELVVPQTQVDALRLPAGFAIRAVLADGSDIVLNSYSCLVEWFGTWRAVEVIVNTGEYPLLGVGLLQGHELHIDYNKNTLVLL